MRFIVETGIGIVLIPLIDYVWLARIMKGFYLGELGSMARLRDGSLEPRLIPAFLVYVFLSLGIQFFALPLARGEMGLGFLWGALLGLIVYGVYDMTNLATLENWSWRLALVDMAWGTFLCGVVTVLVQMISSKVLTS